MQQNQPVNLLRIQLSMIYLLSLQDPMLKKVCMFFLVSIFVTVTYAKTYAETNDFYILPETEEDPTVSVEKISNSGGNVWDTYDDEAYKLGGAETNQKNLGQQMASGIMTRDTLIDYVVYALRFMSQMGLIIGACMFIYSWYTYASHAIHGEPGNAKGAIPDAIIGICIIIFSYAIMKILTRAFLT